jgi:integrase
MPQSGMRASTAKPKLSIAAIEDIWEFSFAYDLRYIFRDIPFAIVEQSLHSDLERQSVLSLIYSGGLRVSEAVHLQKHDIDWERNVLVIRQSKGNKDRQVPLAHHLKDLIQQYLQVYRPKTFLFKGATGGQYTTKTIQKLFRAACEKAEIQKHATCATATPPTSLRAGRTSASSKPSWAIPAPKPRRSTPMYTLGPSRTSKTPSTSCTMHSHPKEIATVTDNPAQ